MGFRRAQGIPEGAGSGCPAQGPWRTWQNWEPEVVQSDPSWGEGTEYGREEWRLRKGTLKSSFLFFTEQMLERTWRTWDVVR